MLLIEGERNRVVRTIGKLLLQDVLAKLEKLGDQASVTAFTELLATLELDGQQPSRFKPGARSTSLYRVQPSRCAGF